MAKKAAVATGLLPTTASGTVDLTVTGFGTVDAAIVFVTNANSTSDPEAAYVASIGFWDGVNSVQHCVSSYSFNAQSPTTVCARYKDTDKILRVVSYTGTCSAVANGIRITVSATTSLARYVTAILIGGATDVHLAEQNMGTGTSPIDIEEPAFKPDMVFLTTAGLGSAGNQTLQEAIISFGAAHNNSADVVSQGAIYNFSQNGQATTNTGSYATDSYCIGQYFNNSPSWQASIGSFDANGFSLTPTASASNDYVSYLAIKLADPDDGFVDLISAATSTGDDSTTGAGFTPDAIGLVSSTASAIDTAADGAVFSFGAADDTRQRSLCVADEDAQGTSDTQSDADTSNVFSLTFDTGAVDAVASLSSMDSDGFTLNYSDAAASAKKILAFAIGDSTGGVVPNPEYLLDEGTEIINSSTPVIKSVYSNATGADVTQANGRTELSFTSASDAQGVWAVFAPAWSGSDAVGTWDFSGSDKFGFDFGYPADPSQYYSYITIHFKCNATETDYTDYFTTGAIEYANWARDQEYRVLLKDDFSVGAGSPSWDAVTSIAVVLSHSSGGLNGENEIYLYSMTHGIEMQPYLLISFDDGETTVYDEAFKGISNSNVGLESVGIPATMYFNSDSMDVSGFCTWAEVAEMYADGWDWGNQCAADTYVALPITSLTSSGTTATCTTAVAHGLTTNDYAVISGAWPDEYNGAVQVTVSSTTVFTYTIADVGDVPSVGLRHMALPSSNYLTTINDNTQEGIDRSYTRGLGHFAYSFGAYDDTAISIFRDDELWVVPMNTAATVLSGVNPLKGVDYIAPPDIRDPNSMFKLHRIDAGANSYTASELLAFVDDAIARGGICHIYFHQLVSSPTVGTEYSLSEWATLLSGLDTRVNTNGDIEAVTISQLFSKTGPRFFLSGAVPGTGSIAGISGVIGTLASVIQGASTVSSELASIQGIDSQITGSSTIEGETAEEATVQSGLAGSSTIEGETAEEATVQSGLTGSSSIQGDAKLAATLIGLMPGVATLLGDIATAGGNILELSGEISGTAILSSILNKAALLSSSVQGSSSLVAETNAIAAIQAALTGASTIEGSVSLSSVLSGILAANSVINGDISFSLGLTGSVDAISAVTVELQQLATITSGVAATSTLSSDTKVLVTLTGSIDGIATITGAISDLSNTYLLTITSIDVKPVVESKGASIAPLIKKSDITVH